MDAPDLPQLYAVIDGFLDGLRRHHPATDLMERYLLSDFRVGYRGGQQWTGLDGLSTFLSQREFAFDERLELRQILSYGASTEDALELTTRLDFFFRTWRAPHAESREFSGSAFHTWHIVNTGSGPRIAGIVIDGFASLNDNARRAFAVPDEGFDE